MSSPSPHPPFGPAPAAPAPPPGGPVGPGGPGGFGSPGGPGGPGGFGGPGGPSGPGGPGGPPPGRPAGKGTNPAVVVLLVVVAVAVVGGGLLLLGGGDDGGDGGGDRDGGGQTAGQGDPAQVVVDYMEAVNARDCGRMVELLAPSSLSAFGTSDVDEARAACESMDAEEVMGAQVTIEDATVTSNDGTTATVELTGTSDGETETIPITVHNVDGSWKVDLLSTVGEGASGGAAGPGPDGDEGASPVPSTGADGTSGTSGALASGGSSEQAAVQVAGAPVGGAGAPAAATETATGTVTPAPAGGPEAEPYDCSLTVREQARLSEAERAEYGMHCRGVVPPPVSR